MRLRRSLALVMGLVLVRSGTRHRSVGTAGQAPDPSQREGGAPGWIPSRSRQSSSARSVLRRDEGAGGRRRGAQYERVDEHAAEDRLLGRAARTGRRDGASQVARRQVMFRYGTLINAFSAHLGKGRRRQLAQRADVASVQPVSIVRNQLTTSVPFIGAPEVWSTFGVRGAGDERRARGHRHRLHARGLRRSRHGRRLRRERPELRRAGHLPDREGDRRVRLRRRELRRPGRGHLERHPRPDFDPLDRDGHGTHTGGTCCGIGVPGQVGARRGAEGQDLRLQGLGRRQLHRRRARRRVRACRRPEPGRRHARPRRRAVLLRRRRLRNVELASRRSRRSGSWTSAPSSWPRPGTPATRRRADPRTSRHAGDRTRRGRRGGLDRSVRRAARSRSTSRPSELPDNGIMRAAGLVGAIAAGGITDELFDAREIDPRRPGGVPRRRPDVLRLRGRRALEGHIALIFKGSTGDGRLRRARRRCSTRRRRAPTAVIFWNGFGGLPVRPRARRRTWTRSRSPP